MDSVRFLRHFVGAPRRIGAVSPSSPRLARRMLKGIDWREVRSVVEAGPGTGSVTRELLKQMPEEARLLAVELHPELCRIFRRRYPQVPLAHDSVEHLERLCGEHGMEAVDCVVSGLPWASFPPQEQRSLLDAIVAVLRPGGQFVTFAYLQGMLLPSAHRFQKLLQQRFSVVRRSGVTWANLPPAFVYRCRR